MSKEPYVGSIGWKTENPLKFAVFNANLTTEGYRRTFIMSEPWAVGRKGVLHQWFPTHAKAMAYADREARRA